MPTSGVKLNEAQLEELGAKAFEMASKSVSYARIAEILGVHRNTVRRLVNHEVGVLRRERKDGDRERAIGVYKAVQEEAWDRLGRLKDSSQNVTGCLNVIIQAQRSIDEITGVRAPVEWKGRLESIDLSKLEDDELDAMEQLLERAAA